MKLKKPLAAKKPAPAAKDVAPPVDPERLRRQFPALTEAELAAYVTVTRSIMTADNRAAVLRGVITKGREAQDRGGALQGEEETLAVAYLNALGKMQGPAAKPH
jgi:hypothetical protein